MFCCANLNLFYGKIKKNVWTDWLILTWYWNKWSNVWLAPTNISIKVIIIPKLTYRLDWIAIIWTHNSIGSHCVFRKPPFIFIPNYSNAIWLDKTKFVFFYPINHLLLCFCCLNVYQNVEKFFFFVTFSAVNAMLPTSENKNKKKKFWNHGKWKPMYDL